MLGNKHFNIFLYVILLIFHFSFMHLQDSVHHLFWTGFLRADKRQRFRFGDLRITSLLFTDDPVVLASSVGDLQITLRWFASDYEEAGLRINAFSLRPFISFGKRAEFSLWLREELLPSGRVQVSQGLF